MLKSLRAAVFTPWLLVVALATLALGTLAYQAAGSFSIPPEVYSNHLYFRGFEPPEGPPEGRFRWSLPDSCVCLPGLGSYPFTLRLQMAGVYPPGSTRQGRVLVNGQEAGQFTLHDGWNDLAVEVQRAQVGSSGDLAVTFDIEPLQLEGDPRPLGVQLRTFEIVRDPASRYVWPAPKQLGLGLLGALLLFFGAAVLGVRQRSAALLTILAVALWALGLAAARLPVAAAGEPAVWVVLLTFAAVLAARAAAGWLYNRGGVRATRHEWQALCGLFAAAMFVKGMGLLHPAFLVMDHVARLHQLARFSIDPPEFLRTYVASPPSMGLGGQLDLGTAMPYSPLFYVLFSPLNVIFPDEQLRLDALNLLMAALEASTVFLLFYAVKRGWNSGIAGVLAAAVFVSLPITNLLFSDGGYPSIFAQWLLALVLALLAAGYARLRRYEVLVPLALALALALLAHTGTTLLLAVQLAAFLVLVAVFDRSRFAGALAWGGLASAVAFFIYYIFTVPLVVGEIIPRVVERLRGSGSIGQDPTKLGGPLLTGFWPQIAGHFGTWPALMALAGYAGRAARLRRSNTETAAARPRERTTAAVTRLGLTMWSAAGILSFALFSLVDLKVNLLQKHMQFVESLLAVFSGLALAGLWKRGRAGRALTWLLLSSLAWVSLLTWAARVLYRTLPPGSG